MTAPFIIWFKDTDDHHPLGKASKHIGNLAQAGFPILPGFVITEAAYKKFLKENNLDHKIKKLLETVNHERPESVYQVAKHIQDLFEHAKIPDDFLAEAEEYYKRLNAVRTTLTAHSTAKSSHKIAHQTVETFDDFKQSIKNLWTKHFEPNHFWKRHEHGHDQIGTGVEILVEICLDAAQTGKIHTMRVKDHAKDLLTITVHHPHASDVYTLSKNTLMILKRELSHYANAPKLTHDALLELAQLGKSIEQHLYFPQEISWVIADDMIFITQTKPISTLPQKKEESKKKPAIARGISLTTTIGSGPVTIIHTENDWKYTTADHIIVISDLETKQLPKLKKVKGIIAEKGEKHAEISVHIRQLGIPTIIKSKDAKKKLKNGHVITIHAGRGEVYAGGF